MAIRVLSDSIQIGNFKLTETSTGLLFDGVAGLGGVLNNAYGYQGSISGYVAGGRSSLPGLPALNTIDKYPFASDSNATDVGDLASAIGIDKTTASSLVSGYQTGGYNGGPRINDITKFPFAAGGNTSDVGDLTQARNAGAGQSSSVHGYASGGAPGNVNVIDKFPFAANANASDVGDLTNALGGNHGQSSSTHGYNSAGSNYPNVYNVIDRFPFAANANATDVGDLTVGRYTGAGISSKTHGYVAGGILSGPLGLTNVIEKFPFAVAAANATDVGDIIVNRRLNLSGTSSQVSGYTAGGYSPGFLNVIEKFPFASDSNSSDVGDLTQGRASTHPEGNQF